MSEMKPMAWLADDGCGLLMATIDKSSAYEVCASEIGVGLVSPLYTADQLAEAVAAERERCAKVCRNIADSEFCNSAGSDAITAIMCSEAIRSAAK